MFSEIVCWIVVGILGLFAVVWGLTRGLGSLAALVLLFVHSPLPWWILTPAAIAIVAGFVYLFKHRTSRIAPNRKRTRCSAPYARGVSSGVVISGVSGISIGHCNLYVE